MKYRYDVIMHKGLAMAVVLLLSLCCPSLSFGHLPHHGEHHSDCLSQDKDNDNPNLNPNSSLPLGGVGGGSKEVLHSSMIGVGFSNILDTYLSSYNSKGTDIRVQRETLRMTNLWKGHPLCTRVVLQLHGGQCGQSR